MELISSDIGRKLYEIGDANMNEQLLVTLSQECFWTLLKIAGPLVLIAMVVGFLISLLQATTQIQEQTLVFVPKLVAILLTLIFLGPYFLNEIIRLVHRIYEYMIIIS